MHENVFCEFIIYTSTPVTGIATANGVIDDGRIGHAEVVGVVHAATKDTETADGITGFIPGDGAAEKIQCAGIVDATPLPAGALQCQQAITGAVPRDGGVMDLSRACIQDCPTISTGNGAGYIGG